jgi:hypothetical protein
MLPARSYRQQIVSVNKLRQSHNYPPKMSIGMHTFILVLGTPRGLKFVSVAENKSKFLKKVITCLL